MHQNYASQGAAVIDKDAQMATFMPGTVALDGWVWAITIDHLLTHRLGWLPDYTRRQEGNIIAALGVSLPLTKRNTYDYVTQNIFLDYYPGQDSGYSNLGFNIAGQVIEQLNAPFSYEQYVSYNILAPLGISRGRLGGSFKSEIPADEVFYHPYDPSIRNSPVSAAQPLVSEQYGGEHIANRDAQGGWVMAAADYAKILSAFDLPANPILPQAQVDAMWTLVPGTDATLRGWSLGTATDANGQSIALRGHNGRLAGSRSLIVRRDDGLSFVFFTNGDKTRLSVGTHGGQLSDLANTVTTWPNHDLFPSLGLPSGVSYTPGTAAWTGSGCFGSGGVVSLHALDAPDLGQPVRFQISRAPILAPSLLLLGFDNPSVSLAPFGAPGCSIYCEPGADAGHDRQPDRQRRVLRVAGSGRGRRPRLDHLRAGCVLRPAGQRVWTDDDERPGADARRLAVVGRGAVAASARVYVDPVRQIERAVAGQHGRLHPQRERGARRDRQRQGVRERILVVQRCRARRHRHRAAAWRSCSGRERSGGGEARVVEDRRARAAGQVDRSHCGAAGTSRWRGSQPAGPSRCSRRG